MELFLPGLIILVLSAFFVFLILPRMGSMVLAVVCIIALLAAAWNHYTLFYSEYQLSTWQYSLSSYTPWVVLGFAFLAMIGSVIFMVSGPETREKMLATPMEAIQQGVSDSVAAMPAASSATNPVTAGINQAITGVTNATNTTNPPNPPNAKKNKSPNIPGLGFAASNV